MPQLFNGKGAPLSQRGFNAVIADLGVDAPSLWALLKVETNGFGFFPDRRLKLLYERHIFHKRTAGKFSAAHQDISSGKRGGYQGGTSEYDRLESAMKLDAKAAVESASWGLGQIMGFNAETLGYPSAESMVGDFAESEDAQLDGVKRFMEKTPKLATAFRTGNWDRVAFYYNGSAYEENAYHIKLEKFHGQYLTKGAPSIDVRAAQVRLVYLGFDPRGVDGLLGNGTKTALVAFQKKRGIPVTSALDSKTQDELVLAAGI